MAVRVFCTSGCSHRMNHPALAQRLGCSFNIIRRWEIKVVWDLWPIALSTRTMSDPRIHVVNAQIWRHLKRSDATACASTACRDGLAPRNGARLDADRGWRRTVMVHPIHSHCVIECHWWLRMLNHGFQWLIMNNEDSHGFAMISCDALKESKKINV